ncbi:conserved transmembrane protein found in conjugative transposon [Pedobacter sp. BAL39]|uniref:conjugative transposon protein TraJ n=1 Tax=Pedobacter sp. BAL39 TaxID=391596 RepID=UPI0001559EF7|nr:conjugative transposon protein TraJ [Pedobacter sp. BAL39]EDM37042.1 conserved transmembrane protein found in conjugative transposon [Pedobacter sp. BAL39]
MNRFIKATLFVVMAMLLTFSPIFSFGQGLAGEMKSMHLVLDQVYKEMIPLCSGLIGVGRGLAGFAALFYIASRVWKNIAQAEAVDFYPLLRPFALGLAILLFPAVIGLMNGILQPTVSATSAMVKNSDRAIAVLLKQKENTIKKTDQYQMYVGADGTGDSDKYYKYLHPDDPNRQDEGMLDRLAHGIDFAIAKASYNFRNSIKQWMSEVLQVVYAAASLCINTIRTFYLIILAILGPLVFAFAVFDGFEHTLTVWIARYVNIFLWLPIANIFGSIIGKVQENMLRYDISQNGQQGDTFFSSTDTAYLCFLIIGIIGYFSVPTVANYIVHAGGGNSILSKVNSLVIGGASTSTKMVSGGAGMAADAMGNAMRNSKGGSASEGNDYFKNKLKSND